MAEREGFEPPVPYGTPDFESGTFDHSATSPLTLKDSFSRIYGQEANIIRKSQAKGNPFTRLPVILECCFMDFMKGLYFVHAPLAAMALFLSCCNSSKQATVDFADGRYEGMVDRSGRKHGMGSYVWKDKSKYEGQFEKDARHGRGRFTWKSGEIYEGEYLKGKRTGQGSYKWTNGSSYVGEFLNGKRHGEGTFVSPNGARYQGNWSNDLQDGEGVMTRADGSKLVGIWKAGKPPSLPEPLPEPSPVPVLPAPPEPKVIEVKTDPTPPPPPPDPIPAPPPVVETIPTPPLPTPIPPNPPVAVEPLPPPAPPPFPEIPTPSPSIEPAPPPAPPSVAEVFAPRPEPPQTPEPIPKPLPTAPATGEDEVVWRGTTSQAENYFENQVIGGIDVVHIKKTGQPFTGKFVILRDNGSLKGMASLVNGKLHGEEVVYDNAGNVIERNNWQNGRLPE